MEKLQRSYTLLGYAGLGLFIILSVAVIIQLPLWAHSPSQWFLFYSAVILSFLSGSLWAQAMNGDTFGYKQLFTSNAVSLVGFACLLLPSSTSALIILTGGYIYIYYCEWHGKKRSRFSKHYQKLRFRLTSVVVFTHLLVACYQ
ncbi:DUF3429 domain-containing protein [Agarivorans sp. MS3-6]